jgi:hypothetical protein
MWQEQIVEQMWQEQIGTTVETRPTRSMIVASVLVGQPQIQRAEACVGEIGFVSSMVGGGGQKGANHYTTHAWTEEWMP